MTTDTKQLAEFAAEFIGYEQLTYVDSFVTKGTIVIDINESTLFYKELTSPILAHLAKREMEKRGFWWHSSWFSNGKVYSIFFSKLTSARPGGWRELEVEHENEYIALWSAIKEALGEE